MTDLLSSDDPIRIAVDAVRDPLCERSLGALGAVRAIERTHDRLRVRLRLGYPQGAGAPDWQALLAPVAADAGCALEIDVVWEAPAGLAAAGRPSVAGVRNILAVASGKGGVGKSTTAANLALALAAAGARTAILDADIYGPSQSIMLGVPAGKRPEVREYDGKQFFVPVRAHGLQAMSMGFLVDEDTPMVWRGPMVSGALQQLLTQSAWEAVDYLIVDMPPGTGDIQLTLSQKVPLAGAIIVTTPQDIALLDARKGIEMFRKVDVPVLGIVENMSTHVCPECGHVSALFGSGGGARIAADYHCPLLGQLPLDLSIRERADNGAPTVVSDPDGPIAAAYREAALKAAAALAVRALERPAVIPNISIET